MTTERPGIFSTKATVMELFRGNLHPAHREWRLVHIQSFMEVTGYKTDVWLVKTVGALLIPVAVCLYLHLVIHTDHRPRLHSQNLPRWHFSVSIPYYVAIPTLTDAMVELLFLVLWIYVAFSARSEASTRTSGNVPAANA